MTPELEKLMPELNQFCQEILVDENLKNYNLFDVIRMAQEFTNEDKENLPEKDLESQITILYFPLALMKWCDLEEESERLEELNRLKDSVIRICDDRTIFNKIFETVKLLEERRVDLPFLEEGSKTATLIILRFMNNSLPYFYKREIEEAKNKWDTLGDEAKKWLHLYQSH